MSNNVVKNLASAIIGSQLSISDIARRAKISRQMIYKILNNEVLTLSTDTIEKISNVIGVKVSYIINPEEPVKKIGVKIPVLGTIPAGVPIEAIEEILDYEEITEDLARTGDFFALKVSGDSMAPQILENDIVIIKKQDTCENNDVCAVIVNGFDATLKRVKKDTNGIMLVPYNRSYEPTYYSNEQVISLPIKIIGKAIEIRRGL